MNSTETLAAGLRPLPTESKTSFASTQAAWRFYQNERVSLSKLAEPLLNAAHEGVSKQCGKYALCIHDWSRLNYRKHTNKQDRYQLSHKTDVGYDLQSSILVSDQTGKPIAPVAQRLVTANKSYANYEVEENSIIENHLNEVTNCIHWLETQQFEKPLLHIIDREADSVAHLRQWKNSYWLTRSRVTSSVEYQGISMRCSEVVDKLKFSKVRKVDCKGRLCWQWVASTPIRITRKSQPSQKKQKKQGEAGDPVEAQLIVSRIISSSGEVIADWLLITNVMDIQAKEIALFYYWRWQIESWFKLLKQGGHDLESWQQETGKAIAKRLLVVSMACVVVWEIATAKGKSAREFREFLIKLSGRQMKYNESYSNPALLAGLWVFISMQEVLQTYSSEQLKHMTHLATKFLP